MQQCFQLCGESLCFQNPWVVVETQGFGRYGGKQSCLSTTLAYNLVIDFYQLVCLPASIIVVPEALINTLPANSCSSLNILSFCMRLPRYRCSLNNGILFKGQTTIHKRKTIVSLPRKPHFAFKWSLGKFLPCDSSRKSQVDFNELILF